MNELPNSVLLWFAALLVQSVAFGVLGTWWVSNLIAAIRDEIARERKDLDSKIANERRELDHSIVEVESNFREQLAATQRMTGESIAAMREYIHTIEKFMRDTYVRRDSFYTTSNEVKLQIKEFADRLDQRLNRLERKVDNLHSDENGE